MGKNSTFKLATAIFAGLTLFGYANTGVTKTMNDSLKNTPLSLWELVDTLKNRAPYTREKIELAINSKLTEVESSNDVFHFYRGGDLPLREGIVISKVDLRIKRAGVHPGFLVVDLTGTCVPLESVQRHYARLERTGVPRGRSLEEATSYSSLESWGKLSFGFREKNPGCLAFIAFDPKT
ncbi:hypothetical protein WKW79_36685 [Variovorax robiniae]|uniref:ASCH domain-containing protein n=1 Tax=Variovorax robiniae TaxID=1836199 RepID=A0ABU8XJW4_9BURK